MNTNDSHNSNVTGRLVGIAFLALLWVGLVVYLFNVTGFNLKNILIAAFSGIIIFNPLWKKYIRPILERHKNT